MLGHAGKPSRAMAPTPFTFKSVAFLCGFAGLALVLVIRYTPPLAVWDSAESSAEIHTRAGARHLLADFKGPNNGWTTPFGQNVTVQIQVPGQAAPLRPQIGGFSERDFDVGSAALTQLGSKFVGDGNLLMLNGDDQATKALWKQPFSIVDGKKRYSPAFRTSFTLDIQAASCLGDGVAFVITSDKRIGRGGEGIGYAGANSKSVIVEFDTVYNAEVGDIDSNHVGINLGGNPQSVVQASFGQAYQSVPSDENSNKAAGQNPVYLGQAPVSVWIEYRAMILSIWASHGLNRPDRPVLSYRIDLFNTLQPQSYVGFTAASGVCQLSVATVSNWEFVAETYDENNPCLTAFQAGQVLCPTANTNCNYEGPGKFSCS